MVTLKDYPKSCLNVTIVVNVIILFTLLILSGCKSTSGESVTPAAGANQLKIESTISSRASGEVWEYGDQIGVFMFETKSSTLVGEANTPYVTLSTLTEAIFSPLSTILYYPDEGSVDVWAYYKYTESILGTSLGLDLSDQSNPSDIDLIVASKLGVESSSEALALTFEHVLSKVTVVLESASDGGVTAEQLAGATIGMSGVFVEASYDLISSDPIEITAAESSSITLNSDDMDESNLVATAIVIPQSATPTFTIDIPELGSDKVVVAEVSFVAGMEYKYTIKVSNSVALSIGGSTIKEWDVTDMGDYSSNLGSSSDDSDPNDPTTGEAYSIGDLYPSDEAAVGVVFSVSDGGYSGKVVSLMEMSTAAAWGASGVLAGASDSSSGLNNMATIYGSYTIADYPPFSWAHSLNSNTSSLSYLSESTGVWYLPSNSELRELFAGMSGLQWIESGVASTGEVADWGNGAAMANYASYAAARAAFNATIVAADGVEINTLSSSYMYWSSTEVSAVAAHNIIMSDGGYIYTSFPKNSSMNARAILVF